MTASARLLGPVLACPDCRAPLGADLRCGACAAAFAERDGVLRLLPANGATNAGVQAFYDVQPFPDYEDLDSPRALRERAGRSVFARLLDEQLPLEGITLEAGCGTGQLTNYLALSRRPVVGLDFCARSLQLASEFRDRFAIDSAHFVQADIFRAPFRGASFDNIVSLGVLHHTDDPEGALRQLVDLLRPGGHVVLGLYNRYGRIPTKLRGYAIRALGLERGSLLDPVVRKDRRNQRRRRAWLRDQYFHPLERTHTVDEVLAWFARAGLAFVNGVPKFVFGEAFASDEQLFVRGIAGGRIEHLFCQLGWAFTHGWEGGLFVLIGRKRGGPGGTDRT